MKDDGQNAVGATMSQDNYPIYSNKNPLVQMDSSWVRGKKFLIGHGPMIVRDHYRNGNLLLIDQFDHSMDIRIDENSFTNMIRRGAATLFDESACQASDCISVPVKIKSPRRQKSDEAARKSAYVHALIQNPAENSIENCIAATHEQIGDKRTVPSVERVKRWLEEFYANGTGKLVAATSPN
jgi:hypothetical protein